MNSMPWPPDLSPHQLEDAKRASLPRSLWPVARIGSVPRPSPSLRTSRSSQSETPESTTATSGYRQETRRAQPQHASSRRPWEKEGEEFAVPPETNRSRKSPTEPRRKSGKELEAPEFLRERWLYLPHAYALGIDLKRETNRQGAEKNSKASAA